LFGHSLGGLFAVYTLFHRAEMFESYVISSPALWWDDGAIWKIEQDWARTHQDLMAHVLLVSGSLDDGQLPSTRKLDDLFRSRGYRGLVWSAEVFEKETHGSVGVLSLSRAIRWLYGDLASKP
jgi:predicted alpha/beta superfamily hydrolase